MAAIDIVQAIKLLRKLGQKIEKLKWRGTFDDQKVDVKRFHFSLVANQARITTEFGIVAATHTLQATYSLTDRESDEIQFDGREVEEDDVRFDLDVHLFYATLEYWFVFVDEAGARHELRLEARVPWSEL